MKVLINVVNECFLYVNSQFKYCHWLMANGNQMIKEVAQLK
jgi:hypothetical protein